jgi:hypothetical protein
VNTTLSLNIDKDVSQLAEDHLASVSFKTKVADGQPLGPITRQLAGIIKLDKKIDRKKLLADALMEKYI